MPKIIYYLFALLFFLTPLAFFPKTSELFEFNKLVILYIATACIVTCWVWESIIQKKIVFKKTLLDIPLLVFLCSQILSTIFSSDVRSSVFGFYTRWNGGLLSVICYCLLYWAFVSFGNKRWVYALLKISFVSALITGVWATLEHFGHSPSCYIIRNTFDVSCWIQDVQLRVFSTFGQPNWLAAWISIVIPFSWALFLNIKTRSKLMTTVSIIFSSFLFSVLLFTKSKSGILAFGLESTVFWGIAISLQLKSSKNKTITKSNIYKYFALVISMGVVIAGFFGTPFSPSFDELVNKKVQVQETTSTTTALEVGGTDSGVIRRIVWMGAINVWRMYPIFGSGVETFGSSYYLGRPLEHNHVSEWNYLYNKAHNEYLNYLATTGAVGILSYLCFIFAVLYSLFKSLQQSQKYDENTILTISFFSSFLGILITNFFGFSVVPVSIFFFLIPAFTHSLNKSEKINNTFFYFKNFSTSQKAGICITLCALAVVLISIINYWRADYYFALSTKEALDGNYSDALKHITVSQDIISEPTYLVSRAGLYADLAKSEASGTENKTDNYKDVFLKAALEDLYTAEDGTEQNVRILNQIANVYDDISQVEPNYYALELKTFQKLLPLAPTDAGLYYKIGLTYAKVDDAENAETFIKKTISLKPDYKVARRLLAYLYENKKDYKNARIQLEYILKNIAPQDTLIQKELEKLPL